MMSKKNGRARQDINAYKQSVLEKAGLSSSLLLTVNSGETNSDRYSMTEPPKEVRHKRALVIGELQENFRNLELNGVIQQTAITRPPEPPPKPPIDKLKTNQISSGHTHSQTLANGPVAKEKYNMANRVQQDNKVAFRDVLKETENSNKEEVLVSKDKNVSPTSALDFVKIESIESPSHHLSRREAYNRYIQSLKVPT